MQYKCIKKFISFFLIKVILLRRKKELKSFKIYCKWLSKKPKWQWIASSVFNRYK